MSYDASPSSFPSPSLPAADAGDPPSPAAPPGDDLKQLRLRRLEDLQRAALADPDPLLANLGVAQGDTLRIGMRLEEAIDAAWAAAQDPVAGAVAMSPAVEQYLRVQKQVNSFAVLKERRETAMRGD